MLQELVRCTVGCLVVSAPHKFYIAFRYVHPFTEESLEQLERFVDILVTVRATWKKLTLQYLIYPVAITFDSVLFSLKCVIQSCLHYIVSIRLYCFLHDDI